MFGEVSGKIGGFRVLVVGTVPLVAIVAALPPCTGDATFNANGMMYFRSI